MSDAIDELTEEEQEIEDRYVLARERANAAEGHRGFVADKIAYGRAEDGRATHGPVGFVGHPEWEAANDAAGEAERDFHEAAAVRSASFLARRDRIARERYALDLAGQEARRQAAEAERRRAASPLAGLRDAAIAALNRARGTSS